VRRSSKVRVASQNMKRLIFQDTLVKIHSNVESGDFLFFFYGQWMSLGSEDLWLCLDNIPVGGKSISCQECLSGMISTSFQL
jgi:hypothetical protein